MADDEPTSPRLKLGDVDRVRASAVGGVFEFDAPCALLHLFGFVFMAGLAEDHRMVRKNPGDPVVVRPSDRSTISSARSKSSRATA